ncbi:MAG: ParB N-terminal domain-containing protein [Kiloniellales bacterium]
MASLMETVRIPLEEIYVPASKRRTLKDAKVKALAEKILEEGQKQPIQLRRDEAKKRYVLLDGLHRLEALRSLGEETAQALLLGARQH